jgi:hypothetical protein
MAGYEYDIERQQLGEQDVVEANPYLEGFLAGLAAAKAHQRT